MKKFENTLYSVIEEKDPDALTVTETYKPKDKKNAITRVEYDHVVELSKMTGMGPKTINHLLNNRDKIMGQDEAIIMAEALSEKYGEEITPEMLIKITQESEKMKKDKK